MAWQVGCAESETSFPYLPGTGVDGAGSDGLALSPELSISLPYDKRDAPHPAHIRPYPGRSAGPLLRLVCLLCHTRNQRLRPVYQRSPGKSSRARSACTGVLPLTPGPVGSLGSMRVTGTYRGTRFCQVMGATLMVVSPEPFQVTGRPAAASAVTAF